MSPPQGAPAGSTSWAASQWPSDIRWVWAGDPHTRRALRWVLETGEQLPSQALAQVLDQLADDTAERRALATDVLARLIADGRLVSGELGSALTIPPAPSDAGAAGSRIDPWHARTAGRVAEALTLTATISPLHGAVVRRSLAASTVAWCDRRPGRSAPCSP